MKNVYRFGIMLLVFLFLSTSVFAAGESEGSAEQEQKSLTVSVEGDVEHLDPHIWQALLTVWVTGPMNDTLVNYNEDLEIIPRLADDWEFVNDTTFRFNLREGVKFHNGRELVADDVKASIERIKDPNTGSRLRTELEPIDSVEVVNDYTGIIHLKGTFAPLLDKLTEVAIIPIEVVEEQGDLKSNPVGCGPFKFSKWEKDSYIEMVKFDDYWKADEPKVDRLVFKPISEYNSARAALFSGDIDQILWIKNVDIPAFEKRDDTYTKGQLLMGEYYVGFNVEEPPYDDERVRRAISYTIDKEAVVNSVGGGYGGPASAPFLLKGTPYYYDEFEYEQDIQKAKQLLAEAGFGGGLEGNLVTPQTPVEGPLGEIVQSQLKAIGINYDLKKLEVATYVDRVFNKRDYEVMICGATASGDPDSILRRYLYSESDANIFNYNNPRFDELLDKARSTYDQEERKRYYREIGNLLVEESPMAMVYRAARYSALRSYVKGFVFKPNLRYEFRNVTIEK